MIEIKFYPKFKIELLYDQAVPILDVSRKKIETLIYKDMISWFSAVLKW